ncbi:MAG: tetraacyldisaccharide 4'-kinase [Cardiobacteriaceae bacterium]|nr:tetraacyldisaccharide 4'-kinase [Cardiobacteriaceae bacterium]
MPDFPDYWRRRTLFSYLLWPFSILFAVVVVLRRFLYRIGGLRSYRARVPVMIVGNLSVGGNGKTPVVQALAQILQAQGIPVGVISRGYGGCARVATDVAKCPDATIVGDEPLLLWRSTGAPVIVARKRAAAAEKLLQDYPATRLIIADDGLQHYALARDVELVVIASDIGLGNGFLLPAGPLREKASRLCSVDAIVYSGLAQPISETVIQEREGKPTSYMLQYVCEGVYPLSGGKLQPFSSLNSQPLYALTAIARPERFFHNLREQGLTLVACRSLPDHAPLTVESGDFAVEGNLVISSKDAVKTEAWPETLKARTYVVDYRARLPDALILQLKQQLKL